MLNKDKSHHVIKRRSFVLSGAMAGLFGVLGYRLYDLQIRQKSHFEEMADRNRTETHLIRPPRGLIFDRSGVKLAYNQQNFKLFLIPEKAKNLNNVLARLRDMADLSDERWRQILSDIKKFPKFDPFLITDQLSWEQVSQIDLHKPDLPGTQIVEDSLRHYPYGEIMVHLIGYTGVPSPNELAAADKDDRRLLSLPGFRIGKSGIEKTQEKVLRGSAGRRHSEVNAFGRTIKELDKEPASPGQDLTLTIDIPLQKYVYERLSKYESASAAVIDVHRGDIYALVSSPSFDPNPFIGGLDKEYWKQLQQRPHHPLINKAISGLYAPGSTFKMIVALAALEEGILTEHDTTTCTGHIELAGHRFHCWKRSGHGKVDLAKSIRESCDSYFYETALKLGIDKIAAMSKRFGLGAPVGIELPGEKSGLIPTKEWKRQTRGEGWYPGETLIASIGQGYVLSTPLQLAVMTARLAGGGFAMKPSLIKRGDLSYNISPPDLGVKKENLEIIRRAMREVTMHDTGTARKSRIGIENFEMGGKTGTSQVKRLTKEERELGLTNDDRPWKWRDHALFVGYAPLDDPRFAISVVVEHGGSGSATAAPIARDILKECRRLS